LPQRRQKILFRECSRHYGGKFFPRWDGPLSIIEKCLARNLKIEIAQIINVKNKLTENSSIRRIQKLVNDLPIHSKHTIDNLLIHASSFALASYFPL